MYDLNAAGDTIDYMIDEVTSNEDEPEDLQEPITLGATVRCIYCASDFRLTDIASQQVSADTYWDGCQIG